VFTRYWFVQQRFRGRDGFSPDERAEEQLQIVHLAILMLVLLAAHAYRAGLRGAQLGAVCTNVDLVHVEQGAAPKAQPLCV
jgi:hypothetical protein